MNIVPGVMFSIFVLFLVCLELRNQQMKGTIDATHVRFVDYDPHSGNFMFRCGDPSNSTSGLAYDELVGLFAFRAKQNGITFPEKFYLIDLSFWTAETLQIQSESKFFAEHPELGELYDWPIYGIDARDVSHGCEVNDVTSCPSVQPADFSEHDRRMLALHFKDWGDKSALIDRVAMARTLLTTKRPDNVPVVIFGHCTCGCDRTGAFMAAYYMKYLNMTFTETMAYDESVPKRHIDYGMQIYAQWYCSYLYYNDSRRYSQLTDCANCQPFQCTTNAVTFIHKH